MKLYYYILLPFFIVVLALCVQAEETIVKKISGEEDSVYSLAIGEFDGKNVVLAAGKSNKVSIIEGEENSWHAKEIYRDEWYITSCVVGDFYPMHDGNEIAIVGWSTKVKMLYEENGFWYAETIYEDEDWLYDVAICEFDNRTSVFWVGETGKLMRAYFSKSKFQIEEVFKDEHALSTIKIFKNEIFVGGVSGKVFLIANDRTFEEIFAIPSTITTIDIGDIYSKNEGSEIIVGTYSGKVVILYNDGKWKNETILEDEDVISDLAFGEFYPFNDCKELLVTTWSNKAVLIYEKNGFLVRKELFRDESSLFTCAIGNFDKSTEENEAVVAGQLGRVFKLSFEKRGFYIYATQQELSINIGYEAKIEIVAVAKGGYNTNVTFTALFPKGIEYSFIPNELIPTNITILVIKANESIETGEYETMIFAKGETTNSIKIKLIVRSIASADFIIEVNPKHASVIADYSVEFTVIVSSVNNFSQQISLNITGLVEGMEGKFSNPILYPPASTKLTIFTSANSPEGNYIFILTGYGNGIYHNLTISLSVGALGTPDFAIFVKPSTNALFATSSTSYKIQVISIFNFRNPVTLVAYDLPKGAIGKIEKSPIIPTAETYLNINATGTIITGVYFIRIEGVYLGIKHSTTVRLVVNPNGTPDFEIKVTPHYQKINISSSAVYKIEVKTINNFQAPIYLEMEGVEEIGHYFEINPITETNFTYLILKTYPTTKVGKYNISLIGTGSELRRVVSFELELSRAKALVRFIGIEMKKNVKVGEKVAIDVYIENAGIYDINLTFKVFLDNKFYEEKNIFVQANSIDKERLYWKAKRGSHFFKFVLEKNESYEVENWEIEKKVYVKEALELWDIVVVPMILISILLILVIIAIRLRKY
ncbi:MAG: hypothetical protein AB1779_06505 [Candidatus Thermoplasmatota archaeon]